jgi:hypothetical protein
VLTSSGRAELLAEAWGDVLVVHRWRGDERRVLVMSFAEHDVTLASLTDRLRLRSSRVLLRSSSRDEGTLSFGDALVFAGEEAPAGPSEGAA